jgi:hypothetical protein
LLIYASSLPFTNVKVQLLYILHLLQTSNETIELPDGTADTVYQELLLILDKYHVPLGKVTTCNDIFRLGLGLGLGGAREK